MIISKVKTIGTIELPLITGEYSMIPFNMKTLLGLPLEFVTTVKQMLTGLTITDETAYFTIHGRTLKKGETLRRGGPHTDGNYEPVKMSFGGGGGGGWKIGETGPEVDSKLHQRQYINPKGGIILASNYSACNGWVGNFEGTP